MAGQVRRAGAVPVLVLLTDGRANIALDGEPGRERAAADALLMARQLRADGLQRAGGGHLAAAVGRGAGAGAGDGGLVPRAAACRRGRAVGRGAHAAARLPLTWTGPATAATGRTTRTAVSCSARAGAGMCSNGRRRRRARRNCCCCTAPARPPIRGATWCRCSCRRPAWWRSTCPAMASATRHAATVPPAGHGARRGRAAARDRRPAVGADRPFGRRGRLPCVWRWTIRRRPQRSSA